MGKMLLLNVMIEEMHSNNLVDFSFPFPAVKLLEARVRDSSGGLNSVVGKGRLTCGSVIS